MVSTCIDVQTLVSIAVGEAVGGEDSIGMVAGCGIGWVGAGLVCEPAEPRQTKMTATTNTKATTPITHGSGERLAGTDAYGGGAAQY